MKYLRLTLAMAIIAGLLLSAWLIYPTLHEPQIRTTDITVTPALIDKGRYLARAGNCIACHTVPGKTAYTGGRRIATPFGDLFSTNLTPDVETGLGAWSNADFWRAMHHGKSRDGRLLYPAFPYPNYTKVSRSDADALFAYLQSLPAVSAPRIQPTLRFPYNTRLALRSWRALYFRAGEFELDPKESPQFNRGAYLVEGLGHCNACHTPRGKLGGSDHSADYAGGPIPMLGWDALPLAPERPLSDSEKRDMEELLQAGTSRHSVTTGPMAEVVFHSLQHLHADDIAAIVTYICQLPATQTKTEPQRFRISEKKQQTLMKSGAKIYQQHCADCHGDEGKGKPYQYPALAGNRLVNSASATNALQAILYGGYAPSTKINPRPYGMPPYAQQLTPDEIAAVLSYIRGSWGNSAPAVSATQVRQR